ncbi:MAG TPA: response regulator transcription factor [Anaerolineae bacterium]|nr:response regulator transcription factor [Anaerolineae bacterium]HID85015.1 response regulator transcription factor [Anaerolineales bacterium]HIQ09882.1 response regulator transcription factor [Anaerolineaceae bacterium]
MATEKPIRVLLADDHAVVRAGIRQFLEQDPRIEIVAEADDGLEAWAKIAETQPDVVVLDIQMPGASGIEVTRRIRQRYQGMGVLILTAYDDDPYVIAVLQAGANGYVLKTASPREIIQAVHEVYEGRSALEPAIAHKLLRRITAEARHPEVQPLTKRELEVLALVAKGYTNKAIAAQLHISDRTVQRHLAHIFDKLQSRSRTEAVMRAVSLGWLEIEA